MPQLTEEKHCLLCSDNGAAAIMSLIQSARMNEHDPYAYLKDVLTRLQTRRASEIDQLLLHRWMPASVTQGDLGGRLLTFALKTLDFSLRLLKKSPGVGCLFICGSNFLDLPFGICS